MVKSNIHDCLYRCIIAFFFILVLVGLQSCSISRKKSEEVLKFDQLLSELSNSAEDALFKHHFESMQKVIRAEKYISKKEGDILNKMYDVFVSDSMANPSQLQSYLDRNRTMIMAWESPTDGKVSFAWLRLPKNWNAEKEYPLYVQLHGYWSVASKPISYMSFTFTHDPSTTTAFEDGYFLSPWARGNKWYHGISETDVWESIDVLKEKVRIDPKRKYLCGHSMGGYGAWRIALESPEEWAAIGIQSGALAYNDSKYVTKEYAEKLKRMPTYFFWGEQEDELKIANIEAHKLLEQAGNPYLEVVEFEGGHDYKESDVEKMYEWMRTFKNE